MFASVPGGSPIGPFNYIVSNFTSRPVTSNTGTSLTCGNNAYPAYTTLGLTLAHDCFGILININSGVVSTAATDTLVRIGIDPAGGTSFSNAIMHLTASAADTALNGGGHWFYFPLFIKAGSSLGASATRNNATHLLTRVWVTCFGKPTYPHMIRYGHQVDTFGATEATSTGTAVTPGTAAEGAWTQLGGIPQKNYFWWQAGFTCNDATMNPLVYSMDLGIGDDTNKEVVMQDIPVFQIANSERITKPLWLHNSFEESPSGSSANVYGRLQCSGTADAATGMIAYGVR